MLTPTEAQWGIATGATKPTVEALACSAVRSRADKIRALDRLNRHPWLE